MMIEQAILYKFSNIYPNTHFIVKDDGEGEYIAEWNVEDVPQPTQEEIEQWYFEYKKEEKLTIIKQESTLEIYGGFFSATTGHSYDFDELDQNNFTQQMLLLVADPTLDSVDWKTVDAGIVTHTRDQFMGVINDANIHKREILSRFWQKEAQLKTATTLEAVENIKWDNV